MDKIPYTRPSVTELENLYVSDAAVNGWGEKCYDYINKFEEKFAAYLGVKHCIATSSCTGAMQMGLDAIGIGADSEIILADTNWIATVAPILHLKAKPIFVDILPESWCIDPDQVERAINSHTKAVIATHIYGNLCEINRLRKICESHNIILIEDAAEAIGSSFNLVKAGATGEFSTFSFHGTKTITTGEGGMFATNNSELYNKVLTLSNHGRSTEEKRQFWPKEIGYKFKLSNIQAAIGLAQLERIEELVERKRQIFEKYKAKFRKFSTISMNPEPKNTKNGAWMPTLVFDKSLKINRKQLLQAFNKESIDARVFFWPLSSLPMFKSVPGNINSYDIATRSINLPSFHDITDEEIDRISNVILRLLEK